MTNNDELINLLTNIDKNLTGICVCVGITMILLLGALFTYLFSEMDKADRRKTQKLKEEIVKEIKELN